MKRNIIYTFSMLLIAFISSCNTIDEEGIDCTSDELTLNAIVPGALVDSSVTRSTASDAVDVSEVNITNLKVVIELTDGSSPVTFVSGDGHLTFEQSSVDSVYTVKISNLSNTGIDMSKIPGAEISVYANYDSNKNITDHPTAPLYMSGKSTFTDDTTPKAEVHLLRGVAKLRTVVRTLTNSVLGDWAIDTPNVKVKILNVPDNIRDFAPFATHKNVAVDQSLTTNYIDYSERTFGTDWASGADLDGHNSSFKLPESSTSTVNTVDVYSYDQYLMENWLENESNYNLDTNVTTVMVTIPVKNLATSENTTITKTIPLKMDNSYRIKRNHLYTLDIQVLSISQADVVLNLQYWSDTSLNGDLIGGSFDVDKTEYYLLLGMINNSAGGAAPERQSSPLITVTAHGKGIGGVLTVSAVLSDKTTTMSPNYGIKIHQIDDSGTPLASNTNIYSMNVPASGDKVYKFAASSYRSGSSTAAADVENLYNGYIKVAYGNSIRYIPIKNPMKNVIDLNASGSTANCYIVSKPGVYKFNASVMGNGYTGITKANTFMGSENTESTTKTFLEMSTTGATIDPTLTYSARLEWQDTPGLITQVAYNNDEDHNIYFTLPGNAQSGNAVISITKYVSSTNIYVMWSWHIWVTPRPEDFYVVDKTASTGKYCFMDRNLGAKYLTEVNCMYYQYGRKDPFINSTNLLGVKAYDIFNNDITSSFTGSKTTSIGLPNRIQYPKRMSTYTAGYSAQDYYKYLWGASDDTVPSTQIPAVSANKKTIYDPCPIGYKVPDAYAVYYMNKQYGTTTYVEDLLYSYKTFGGQGKFYMTNTGYLTIIPENSFSMKNGFIWSTGWPSTDTSSSSGYWSHYVWGWDNDLSSTNKWTSTLKPLIDCYLVPVRCIKEF